ncbi:MAG TPA: type II secretion system F family protein [Sedimentisphaerales bacterium]|jgi:type II secretory pathway component PulF|nr:type II secretion system F family protein [Sedimentisphaerales bacterium]HNU28373.1 type II secretion system F family protein [Sedimentisphaerales bacterium]
MRSYTYIARDHAGARREGLLAANSPHEALEILHHKRLTPIGVHETLEGAGRKRKAVRRGKVRSADLGAMAWQLSTMLDGGLSITSALEIIAEDTDNLQLRHVLQQTLAKVAEGKLLSDGLGEFPQVFNPLALAIVIAGETSGDLGQALRTLAEYFDNRDRIAKKVRGAVAYPIFVLTLISGIVVGIMTLIIPRFQIIFDQIGGHLPTFTRVFMGFYGFLCHNALYVAIALAGLVFGAVSLSKTRSGHQLLSRAVLRLPLFGKLFTEAFIATFCRTIATLLDAGVPVLESFEILRGMSRNDVICSAIARVKQHVMGGSNVALGMTAAGFFPNMVVKMAQVGEESGSLPMILRKTSDHYERKITATIDTLTRLLEPVMITTVGAIVLVVVIALYLPIFTISDIGH